MFRSYGLRTHIWNNNLKTGLLMAGFPVLLTFLFFGLSLLLVGVGVSVGSGAEVSESPGAVDAFGQAFSDPVGSSATFGAVPAQFASELSLTFQDAWHLMLAMLPFALLVSLIWFVIAYFGHQTMIDMATGARKVTREEEPRLYNLLENLCISRGITMPSLRIADSDALNAFASGLDKKQHSITVTRGLMASLDDKELEAVLAHELTHVRNMDVQLLVIAIVFVGVFSFVGQVFFRNIWRVNLGRGERSRRSGGGGAEGVAILIGLAIIAIAWFLALVIKAAISQSREYIADAGAVELTKDADAMASALRKVSGHAAMIDTPEDMRAFFLENEAVGFAALFASHPPIGKRIQALENYAGAQA